MKARTFRLALAVGAALAASCVLANPLGERVAAGSAQFARNGNILTVTNTPGTIINWQQFSIAQDEITRFIQQNAASGVLNRVVSANPSVVLGTLQSNGRVFLINPSGIAFGAGATIDVAGLAVSTLNMTDSDFVTGRMRFSGSQPGAGIVNDGTIRTRNGGHVYLISRKVENGRSGVITSPKGEVVIAAGTTVELVNPRTPDLRVEITAPNNTAVNAGKVIAASGSVGIYGTVVRMNGRVSANAAATGEGGKVILKASQDITGKATAQTSADGTNGRLDATAADSITLGVVSAPMVNMNTGPGSITLRELTTTTGTFTADGGITVGTINHGGDPVYPGPITVGGGRDPTVGTISVGTGAAGSSGGGNISLGSGGACVTGSSTSCGGSGLTGVPLVSGSATLTKSGTTIPATSQDLVINW